MTQQPPDREAIARMIERLRDRDAVVMGGLLYCGPVMREAAGLFDAILSSFPVGVGQTITRDQIVPHDVIGIKMTDEGMTFQTRNGGLRKPTEAERNGMAPTPQTRPSESGEKI